MFRTARHRYTETIILSTLILGCCAYFNPKDPLFVHAFFPWIWFLPIMIALQHGRLCAGIATTLVVFTMLYTLYALLYSWDSYQSWFLGGITLTFICAEYHGLWLSRQHGLRERSNYLDTRLESLSRAYGILRLSHDTLEESLIIKPATLRQAFMSLREILAAAGGKMNATIAMQYMELLAYQAGLDSAALYLYKNKHWEMDAIACVGKNKPLKRDDVLIKRCLANKETSYLALNILEENQTSEYLAVLPMQTADGHLLGLLTITEIPFLLLNDETLEKLTLMLAYIADEAWAASHAEKLQKIYPDCPAMFASELFKLKHLWQLADVDSAIVVFYLEPSDVRDDVIFFLIKERRALDIIWETKRGESIILIILMPLTERSMLSSYITRIQELLWQRKKIRLDEKSVQFEQRQLSAYTDIYSLLAGALKHDDV